jgi:serine/threonine protein kinase
VPTDPEEGALIAGRFTLRRCLGTGGVGTVWEALGPAGQLFALKFLRPQALSDARLKGRLLREARIVQALHHPRVAKTFELIEFGGAPVIVMELCAGHSLRRHFSLNAPLSAEEVASFLFPLTEALQYCHDSGVVHRDIKPENLYVTDSARADLGIKLLDFGFAKLRAAESGSVPSLITELGTRIGTPWYMAPEQILQPESVDARVDIWSIGVVAYEALTGCLPIEGSSGAEVMRRILNDAIVPLELLAPHTPPEVTRIVERALARPRERRPSLRELSSVLQRYALASGIERGQGRPE